MSQPLYVVKSDSCVTLSHGGRLSAYTYSGDRLPSSSHSRSAGDTGKVNVMVYSALDTCFFPPCNYNIILLLVLSTEIILSEGGNQTWKSKERQVK